MREDAGTRLEVVRRLQLCLPSSRLALLDKHFEILYT